MIDPEEKIRRVELSKPDPAWAVLYSEAAEEIRFVLKDNLVDIHHVGSTAVPGMDAKPIVDILPVVKDLSLVDGLNPEFEALGYVCMGEYGNPGRRFYWKSRNKRTHNIHLFAEGAFEISRHLAFRDFMREHQEYARAYASIKRGLAEVFPEDIVGYVDGKSSFVQLIDYKTQTAGERQLSALDEVVIEEYNSRWPKLAIAEIGSIKEMGAGLAYVAMEHIGSTAVPELASKPVIDIFITVEKIEQAWAWVAPLEHLGYVFWSENPDKTHFRFFKGMPPFGARRTHHVHIVAASNKTMEHRILFRDILRQDKKIRMEYGALKLRLASLNPEDRELYTENKSGFIERVLRDAGFEGEIGR